ncbi:hypothetical protein FQR65_LT12123 [Abscondita terminalis]|nr:hypothetical protein FQR65_LT12123 [Abscondita terminalis]
MELIQDLKKLIKNNVEITDIMKNLNADVRATFLQCYESCFDSHLKFNDALILKADSVVDYLQDELNTGHWSEVPIQTRQAFTCANYVKALIVLHEGNIQKALHCLDLGLLLGAPLNDNCSLLTESASLLTKTLDITTHLTANNKRKAHSCGNEAFEKLRGLQVKSVKCPTLEQFTESYYTPKVPVKLQDCISHWPACEKWTDLNYLLKIAGSRTVPIEIGSHYTDENWTQKLMSLKDFIHNHYLGNSNSVGYLAQHNLFDQISELRNDIRVPDYCGLSRDYDEESCEPDINAWLGPEGTVSPLHFDPKDNLLAQVYGTKQILLYSPDDSDCLYPHGDKLLFNTAQVDPYKPDAQTYPKFASATVYKCLLEPGEMLFIPLKWWHHVTALDKSFSVSFWWK